MTDKKGFADRVRDHATDDGSPHAHQAPDRRRWADVLKHRWPTLFAIAVGALLVMDGVDVGVFSVIMLIVAAVYLPIGAIRGQLRRPGVFMLETVGVLGFGALALGALLVDQQLAQYLLAAAWLGHAAWDFAHHRADMVVPKWYAELCVVLDFIIAAAILALP